MKKFLLFITLLLITSPVFAAELVFEAQDFHRTVMPASSIVGITRYADAQIKIYSKNMPTILYYNNREKFEEDYNRLVNILKQNAYRECIRYGGGNACGKSL